MAKVSRTKYLTNGADTFNGVGETNDRVFGGAGNDSLFGGEGNDYLFGGDDNDILNGGEDSDWLHGGNGDDVINGGEDSDILTGGFGADTFQLPMIWGEDADTITDFTSGVDKLDLGGFMGGEDAFDQETGLLNPDYLAFGTATPGNTNHAVFVYDKTSGKLYYDNDGSGGSAQTLVATLLGQPNLKASDIFSGNE